MLFYWWSVAFNAGPTLRQRLASIVCTYAVKSENVEDYWWATTSREGEGAGPVFSYKLRYIVGFWLVEMAISTNQKPTIYHNLYENTCPEELLYNFSVFLHHVHSIHFNIGIPKEVYTQLVYMQLKHTLDPWQHTVYKCIHTTYHQEWTLKKLYHVYERE